MQLVEPVTTRVNPRSGELAGASGRYVKRVGELGGIYVNSAAFEELKQRHGQDIAYSVDHFVPATTENNLIFGTSTLQPGDIDGEFFMTRGHLHQKADRPEIYHCLHGHGVMLMETLDGSISAQEMTPGTIVFVPPYWIHRSVNVGPDPFVTLFCYPADAGQNYDIIATAGGMASLVVSDGQGGWKTVPNPRYQPREEVIQK